MATDPKSTKIQLAVSIVAIVACVIALFVGGGARTLIVLPLMLAIFFAFQALGRLGGPSRRP